MDHFSKTRELVRIGLFTAFTCVVALVLKWGGEILVPFSFLPMMSLLAGVLLGSRAGAKSMLAYILMGLVGIPVFAKPPFGGPLYVLQPTFGFLLGFVAAAFLAGWVLERFEEPTVFHYGLAMGAGLLAIYGIGLPYLWLIVNFYLGKAMSVATALKVGVLPFIGLDLIKAGLAAALARMIAQRVTWLERGSAS